MTTFHNTHRYSGIYYNPPDVFNRIPAWIPRLSLSSTTRLYETASRTSLSQIFINSSSSTPIANAKYSFPLYESCAVVSFKIYVGTRVIEGVVKEKEEAAAQFNEALGRNESAGLFEQHTPDVFTTSLGNIPAGETVKVEIEYIMELKHDAEVDGLRFTIPTSIAPRYGEPPQGLGRHAASPVANTDGMRISVEITMSSNITSIQVCTRFGNVFSFYIILITPPTSHRHTRSQSISADTRRIQQTMISIQSMRSRLSPRHPQSSAVISSSS
jgi:Vault protein inter-alpha-trypsin domain